SAVLRAHGHRARGNAVRLRGAKTEARDDLEKALKLAEGDPGLRVSVWADLGVLHHQAREMDRARECYETALAMPDLDEVTRARCLGNLGAIEHDVRQYDAALE